MPYKMGAVGFVCFLSFLLSLGSCQGDELDQTHLITERKKDHSARNGHCLPFRRILGGEDCSRNEMPSIVQILKKSKNGTMFTACAGTLIKADLILTAAHCVHKDTQLWAREATDNDPENETETDNQRTEIIAQWVHPQFINKHVNFTFPNGSNVEIIHVRHDIGLMHIQMEPHIVHWRHAVATLPKASFGADICSVCNIVQVMGWGRVEPKYRANTLQCVAIPVTPMHSCMRRNVLDYTEEERDDYLCTSTKGKMSLQGDSGGPVICQDGGLQIGVVSWGRYKKDLAIYTRIDRHLDFIQSVIKATDKKRRRLAPIWKVWEINAKVTFFNDVGCFMDMIVYHVDKYLHNFQWA